MLGKRIDWGTLWMTMALTVSQRSIDPSTKHGCIIVDEKNRLISMGYNSFPRNCVDESLPLTRPEKYGAILHSEVNAIINAGDRDLEGAIAYTTGHPCTNCFGSMINAGISKVVYGPVGCVDCISKDDIILIQQMNIDSKTLKNKIKMIKYEDIANMKQVEDFLDQVKNYTKEKTEQTGVING